MYKLYAAPGAASLAVHWMLIELGVPFDIQMLDLDIRDERTSELLNLNPAGHVPTIVVDGYPVSETGAILMFLAELHPGAGFAPLVGDSNRAKWLQWMVWLANGPMASFRQWFYEVNMCEADRNSLQTRIEAYWDVISSRLLIGQAFAVGNKISTVDFQLTMLMRWSRKMPKPATAWPNIEDYLRGLRARRGLIEVHVQEGLTDWIGE